MAVGAQQHALCRLLACPRKGARDPLATDREALRVAVEVMELQRGVAPVVAAQLAPSAGFEHQLSLDAASLVGDLVDSTSCAPKAALAPHVTGHPVARARELRGFGARGDRCLAEPLPLHA